MIDVIIVGASGHAAEIDDYIAYENKRFQLNRFRVAGFLDKSPENYARYQFSAPLIGDVQDHKVQNDCKYIMGIANILRRRSIVEFLVEKGAEFVTYIHPDTYISASAEIGNGVVIAPNANIGPNVSIGDFTIINARCSIGHDSKIGKFNFITPNVCFSGFTEVGDENLFGINSATIPSIKVGHRNKIAAGMTLDKNVGNDEVVFYRFKEKVIAVPKTAK